MLLNDDAVLTVGDAAREAQNAPATIRSWVLKGVLPAGRTAGGVRLIRLEDLRRVLLARQAAQAAVRAAREVRIKAGPHGE